MDLFKKAEDKLGTVRAEELRTDIEQLQEDTEKIRSIPVDLDDEP